MVRWLSNRFVGPWFFLILYRVRLKKLLTKARNQKTRRRVYILGKVKSATRCWRRVAQWWEHSPPTNVGWVCCWFSPLLLEVFYSGFPLSSKTSISKFQFDQESGRRRTSIWMCYLQILIYFFIFLFICCFTTWCQTSFDLSYRSIMRTPLFKPDISYRCQ